EGGGGGRAPPAHPGAGRGADRGGKQRKAEDRQRRRERERADDGGGDGGAQSALDEVRRLVQAHPRLYGIDGGRVERKQPKGWGAQRLPARIGGLGGGQGEGGRRPRDRGGRGGKATRRAAGRRQPPGPRAPRPNTARR